MRDELVYRIQGLPDGFRAEILDETGQVMARGVATKGLLEAKVLVPRGARYYVRLASQGKATGELLTLKTRLTRNGQVAALSAVPAKYQAETKMGQINPEADRPGTVLALTANRPIFDPKKPPTVFVGKRQAVVQRIASRTEALILVPDMAAGDYEVRVGQDVVIGQVRVLPHEIQRLILSIEKNEVKLLSAKPAAGLPDRQRGTGHGPAGL